MPFMLRKASSALVILVAIAALLTTNPAHAQEPTTPTDSDRVLLPILRSGAMEVPSTAAGKTVAMPLVMGPQAFQQPWPADGALRQSLNVYLTWQLNSPKWADATFNILLEANDSSPDEPFAWRLSKASYDPPTFAEDTLYYWQVIAENPNGEMLPGPVWHFRTDYFPATPELGALVYVPEGDFIMGCDNNISGYQCFANQIPLHTVRLDAFYLDKYETTNLEYRACVAAGACNEPRRTDLMDDDYFYDSDFDYYPVLYVSHWDAEDYCGWAGKRLPTEAEWEKAARGAIDTRPWPWGNENWDCSRMNRCPGEEHFWFTAPVDGAHAGQSPYGALNMSANAGEWVQDFYLDEYYWESPYLNPVNTVSKPNREGIPYYAFRGGSFHDNWWYSRTSHRNAGHWGDEVGEDVPFFRSFRTGIRCAMSVP
jgi:formylglycine-generating enzyme required for sulfatase activity